MRRRTSTSAAVFVVLVGLAGPVTADSEKDANELRRVENVTVEFLVANDLPEACVGSIDALKDLAQLILSTSRIPVLQDDSQASHLVTWNFRAREADADTGGTGGQCVTIGELDIRPHAAPEDGPTGEAIAYKSSFEAAGRTRRQVSDKVRRSVSRGTTVLAREILNAKQSAE